MDNAGSLWFPMPDSLQRLFDTSWSATLVVLVLAGMAAAAGWLALHAAVRHLRLHRDALAIVLRHCVRPAGVALLLLAADFVLTAAQPPLHGADWLPAFDHGLTVALLLTLTWLAVRALLGVQDVIVRLQPDAAGDGRAARRMQTQTRVLLRFGILLVGAVGVGSILMTFPSVRHFGASILASAGVAGIVVGFAARPVLTNLLAGLQIALTQPLLLGDVLVVQNQQGVVAEITGTYVVLAVWDGRRLVIPLQWFVENPFQNLTRTSAQMLGSYTLWVDYALPLAPLRAELTRLVRAAPEWDGRSASLAVAAADARALQLAVTLSSANADDNMTLGARVLEGLIDFLQREYPRCLPRLRLEERAAPGSSEEGALRG